MKKTTQLLASAILLSTVSTGVVLAAGDGGLYESNGIVEFTPSTDPTKPVDPTDPTKPVTPVDPIDPTNPVTPGTNGPLSIDYASSLNFGKQSITSENKTYHASAQTYSTIGGKVEEKVGPNYVQVTDNRGNEAGWTLKVNQDGQFKTSEGKELTGAVITFNNGHIVTNSASGQPTGSEQLVLNSNGDQSNVMTATAGSGAGTYINAWGTNETDGEKSIELSVPGSTTKYAEKYTAKLVWTLTDVPGN